MTIRILHRRSRRGRGDVRGRTPRPGLGLAMRAGAIALLLVALGLPLVAHLAVSKTYPVKGATLASSPDHLQVWFTQEPELPVSGLTLKGSGGAIALGAIEAGGDKSIRTRIGSALAPGTYTVEWKTAGDDGHVLRGRYSFAVGAPRAR